MGNYTHCTDLSIDGTYSIGELTKNIEVKINKINHVAKGETFASDVKEFLQAIRPDIYIDIYHACSDHVRGLITEEKAKEKSQV